MRNFRWFWIAVVVSTLLVACNSEKQGVTTSISPSRGVRISNTVGTVERLMLQGRWLVWKYTNQPPDYTQRPQQGFAVYDLSAQELVYTDTVASYPIRIVGDTLYYARLQDVQWLAEERRPNENGWSLNRLDLKSMQDTLILDKVPVVETDGQIAAWSLADTCQAFTTCAQQNQPTCPAPGSRLYVDNLVTGELQDLGTYGFVADISDGVVYIGHASGPCSIHTSDGPYDALDLQSQQLREVSPFTGMAPFAALRDVTGRRALIDMGANRIVVMDIPTQHDTQIVLNVNGGQAFSLAGHDILLYAPAIPGVADGNAGLVALGLENGDTDQLVGADERVWQAVGDSQHVAWTYSGRELYWAELHLQPSGQPTLLDTPAPTLEPYFPSLHLSPMWTPAPLVMPTIIPSGTARP